MGAPVPPVLVVSAVSLTLHDVLLASVARELVAHKAVGRHRKVTGTGPGTDFVHASSFYTVKIKQLF